MGLKRNKPLQPGAPLKRTPMKPSGRPLRRDTGPKQRSAKTEKVYAERRPLVKRLLAERPECEACPVFATHDGKVVYRRNPSCDVHELVRRSQGGSILDESNLLCVCRSCHSRIGDYPQLAFDLGLAKHGWERDR